MIGPKSSIIYGIGHGDVSTREKKTEEGAFKQLVQLFVVPFTLSEP